MMYGTGLAVPGMMDKHSQVGRMVAVPVLHKQRETAGALSEIVHY